MRNQEVGIKDLKFRQDYLSIDKSAALSAEGEFFHTGDTVFHQSTGNESATIESFSIDNKTMDVIATTSNGNARISFLYTKD